jgi:hypothetical protein
MCFFGKTDISQKWKPETYVRSEVFTAVAVKIVVYWDIKTQFIPHRRHITSSLQRPAS